MGPWLIGIVFLFGVYVTMAIARAITWRLGCTRASDRELLGTLVVIVAGVTVAVVGNEYFGVPARIGGVVGILAYVVSRSDHA